MSYPFASVEPQIQRRWETARLFEAEETTAARKYYCLSMFPYPSGRLHMGHVRNYTIGDMFARWRRMCGDNVLQPLGWDAFGLPAENAAIDNNIAPAVWTERNIDEMRAQLKRLGLAIDWRREHATCHPEYYRWEQLLFVRLFEKGLIYKRKTTVNWDPVDNTVLANEQVVDGRGWRSGAPIERRDIPMYFMKITAYADELLEELDNLPGWPESVKTMQKNWIGRSEGARIFLPIDGRDDTIECFTTRPDTIFGATFCAIAPEHPLARQCAENDSALAEFIGECRHLAISEEALEKAEKRGYDTGLRVRHPFDSERLLPVYVANFILAQYGTGAIYGCPAHDQRDLGFARTKNLPVIPVVMPPNADADSFAIADTAYTGDGVMIHSDFLNGLTSADAKQHAIAALEKINLGKREQQYRLRDWGVSRQRYWGCPIPVVHCPQCGDVATAENDLPVRLPHDAAIDGRGSPLAKMDDFVKCQCPKCGQVARRETDTLDTFFESSWYFARFASYDCDNAMVDDKAAYWMPVDQYIGGIEHACLHLLYARFFHKLMRDADMYPADSKNSARYNEPFVNLLCQGMVLNNAYYREGKNGRTWLPPAEVSPTTNNKGKIIGGVAPDGGEVQYAGRVKMSKSENNGVDPAALIENYGADTARLFILFAAPPEQSLDWSDEGVRGCSRFLNRLWAAVMELKPSVSPNHNTAAQSAAMDDKQLEILIAATRSNIHKLLAKADYDMQRMRFNNIPSAAMNLLNELKPILQARAASDGALLQKTETFLRLEGLSPILRLLAPAVPHITQALWDELQLAQQPDMPEFIAAAAWPQADKTLLADAAEQTLIVQVNGKKRGQITVAADADDAAVSAAAQTLPPVQKELGGGKPRKTIVVRGRIVNFVV